MQIAATRPSLDRSVAASAAPVVDVDPVEGGWPDMGGIRRGEPGAPPAENVVARARFDFPGNFGAHFWLDVSAGSVLEAHASLDDAIWGARVLANGKASMGVVRQPDGTFTVNELTVPGFFVRPGSDEEWDAAGDATLIIGPDPVIPRSFVELRQLADAPARNGQLVSVWTRSGNTRFDASDDGRFNGTFNHM